MNTPYKTLFIICLIVLAWPVQAAMQRTIELSSGIDVTLDVYGEPSRVRALWLGSSFGLHPRHKQVAKAVAEQGLQVWQTDLTEALFLTHDAKSMREIPPGLVAELIDRLSEGGKYKLVLISSTYGAIPALRGAHAWLAQSPRQRSLAGVILFSPYLYSYIPKLGEEPVFVPVTKSTSIPLYIFQDAKNTNRWHLPEMLTQLRRHATVYTEYLKGVTSLFYDGDQAEETQAMLKAIPRKLVQILPLLENTQYALASPPAIETEVMDRAVGLDDKLRRAQAEFIVPTVSLVDINGKQVHLDNLKGRVSIINFWATWCPPCVEEIPSLNRLQKKMQGKAFQLISINYAEPAKRIKKFMQRVQVDYPVLLDPDGEIAGQWKVVAFPSSFVIGPDGKLKYGVNSAIHWDTAEVVKQLDKLLEK